MTLDQMVTRLQKLQAEGFGDRELMVLDSFNGGGNPRDINLGPVLHVVTPTEAEDSGDCEELLGTTVVVMGFGCY